MKPKSTLFIVDENPSTHTVAQSAALSVGVPTKSFENTEEFFRSEFVNRNGCILLAASGSGLTGVDALAWLQKESVLTPVIILISEGDTATAIRALKSGAVDVIEEPMDRTTLIDRVKQALLMDQKLREAFPARAHAALMISRLTKRERQVFDLLSEGFSNKAVAQQLGCKTRTAEAHRARVMEKLDAKSVVALSRLKLALTLTLHRQPFEENAG